MDGGSLSDKMKSEKISPLEAAKLVATLADTLETAHKQGVIHRDLKPGNVLITADGTLKIADFGLAKQIDSGLTISGAVLGTPSYMAPEQALGNSRQIGPSADIYGLGAILYELLTGVPPFKGSTPWETVKMVIGSEPLRPSRLRPGIPPNLEVICLRCLEKTVSARYFSAESLADDLKRFVRGDGILARPAGKMERGWRWCLRNPLLAGSFMLLIVTLLSGTVVASYFAITAEYARNEARRQVVDLCTTMGFEAESRKDSDLALLWFARGIRMADEGEGQRLNRIRVANWLDHVSRPIQMFSIPGFRDQQDRFSTFEFHPEGTHLLAVLDSQRCFLWNLSTQLPESMPENLERVSSAAWSPNGDRLAVGTSDGQIKVFEFPGCKLVSELHAQGPIAPLVFDPFGRYLAWGELASARVWDSREGNYATTSLIHPKPIYTIRFSPNGDRLVTSCADRFARVFAIGSNGQETEPSFEPLKHDAGSSGVSHGGRDTVAPRFVNQGHELITVARNNLDNSRSDISWWDARSGKLIRTVPAPLHSNLLVAMTVCPRDEFVIFIWSDFAAVWSIPEGREVGRFDPPHDYSEDVMIDPSGTKVISCGQDATARIWSLPPSEINSLVEAQSPIRHAQSVVRARFSPVSNCLATAQWNGDVIIWKLPNNDPPRYRFNINGTTRLAISPDGRYVIPNGVSYRNGSLKTVQFHDAVTGKPVGEAIRPEGIVLDASLSPDGSALAIACSGTELVSKRDVVRKLKDGRAGNVQFWDWKTGQRRGEPVRTETEPRGLAFSPSGNLLALICADGWLSLIRTDDGTVVKKFDTGQRKSESANLWTANGLVRFSPDGRLLITWEMDKFVQVWDVLSQEKLFDLPHLGRVIDVEFGQKSNVLMTSSKDCYLRIWDLKTGKMVGSPLAHPRSVAAARFGPDDLLVYSGCDDGIIRVWDWRKGHCQAAWKFHRSLVHDLRLSSDSQWIVTSGVDETSIFDRRTGTPILPTRWRNAVNLSVQTSPTDQIAFVGGFFRAIEPIDLARLTSPSKASLEELNLLAELVTASQILDSGEILPLSPRAWQQKWLELQTKYPAAIEAAAIHQQEPAATGSVSIIEDQLAAKVEPVIGRLLKADGIKLVDKAVAGRSCVELIGKTSSLTYQLPQFPLTNCTLSFWLQPLDWNLDKPSIVCCANATPSDDPLRILIDRNKLWAEFCAGDVQRFGAIPVEAGKWMHLALVKQTGTLALYVNGQLRGTCMTPSAIYSDADHFSLGSQGGTNYFHGRFSDLRLIDRAISPSDVRRMADPPDE